MTERATEESTQPTGSESAPSRTPCSHTRRGRTRGQSAIIGVALLLGLTIVSVGVLTAGTGILVDEAAQGADAQRVADRLATAYNPSTLEGATTLSLALTGGQLTTEERRITLRRSGDVVATVDTRALRFARGDHHVSVLGQAIIRGQADRARFVRDPGLVTVFGAEDDRTLSVSITSLSGQVDESMSQQTSLRLRLHGSHERRDPGAGRYSISIETATPELWEAYLADIAVSVRIEGADTSQTKVVVAELGRVSRARLIIHQVEIRTDG